MIRFVRKNSHRIGFFLIIISFLLLVLEIISHSSYFFVPFNFPSLKNKFNESQWQQSQNISPDKYLNDWAIKNGYTGWNNYVDENNKIINIQNQKNKLLNKFRNKGISDSDLYIFAGYEYIHGTNPILLNPEHPPLGKYMVGLSIYLFGNPHIITIICSILIFLLFLFCVYTLTQSFFACGLAGMSLALNKLFFIEIISSPSLELFFLLFLLSFILCMISYIKRQKIIYLVLSGIFLGCIISTKTFFIYFFILNAWIFLFFLLYTQNIRTKIINFLLINIIGICIFLLSYSQYFFMGGSIRGFLGVQKWIFMFYQNSSIDKLQILGSFIPLILINKWKVWSTGYPFVSYESWNILWPMMTILGFYSIIKLLKSKKNNNELLLITFILVYILFLTITPIFPRYLLSFFVILIFLISIYISKKWKLH